MNSAGSSLGGPLADMMVTAELQKKFKEQEKSIKQMHKTDLKNVKALAVAESIEFVKKSSNIVTKLLTISHRNTIRQFIEFKNAAYEKMDKQDFYYKEMVATQILLASKFHVLEMEY